MSNLLIKSLGAALLMAAFGVMPGSFQSLSIAQTTPATIVPEAQELMDLPPEALDISDEGLYAMKQYLTTEEKRAKVITLRELLEERVKESAARGRPAQHGDAMIFQIISSFEPREWDNMLKALDQIWAIPDDYFVLLADASGNLDRYRSWLGEGRYRKLARFPEFISRYQDNFLAWRVAQPPRPWRSSEANMGVPVVEERPPAILRSAPQTVSPPNIRRDDSNHLRNSIPRYRMRGPALSTGPRRPDLWRQGDAAVEPRRTSPRVTRQRHSTSDTRPLFVP